MSSCKFLQVVSEEHDSKTFDLSSIAEPARKLGEVSQLPDVTIPLSDIAVWIDPLDPTPEDPGKVYS